MKRPGRDIQAKRTARANVLGQEGFSGMLTLGGLAGAERESKEMGRR